MKRSVFIASKNIGRFAFDIGFNKRQFAIGVDISKYSSSIQLGWVWLSIDWFDHIDFLDWEDTDYNDED